MQRSALLFDAHPVHLRLHSPAAIRSTLDCGRPQYGVVTLFHPAGYAPPRARFRMTYRLWPKTHWPRVDSSLLRVVSWTTRSSTKKRNTVGVHSTA
ncbi:hypothetical protein ADL28_17105 [Streptomyces violaceusniger]|uniref:Uncharacterized protein n=1 Tax=Streptomyces violaceusniger TaxID=68280 RepID=A0A0X3WSP5_STRVO|nr:hypothetical protein ADL28_17105 [Streptomyces violaceusniger]